MIDLTPVFAAWRAELAEELAAVEAELATAVTAHAAARQAEAEHTAQVTAIRARVAKAMGKDPLPIALGRKIERAEEEADTSVSPSAVGWSKRIESLRWTTDDIRDALLALDRIVAPPTLSVVPTVLTAVSADDAELHYPDIEFPSGGRAA